MKILSINPGSTSTKIAVFEDGKQIFVTNIKHSAEEIAKYDSVIDQYKFREKIILKTLEDNGFDKSQFSAIVGRGGLLKPIPSGTYEVNEALLADLRASIGGEHASNLGGIIADSIASDIPGCRAFIADPVVVDELSDLARVAGHPEFKRISIFHALNQKAIAKLYASEIGVLYDSLNLIVAHLGGGVSVGAHCHGKVIDVNNALNGDGPFSPERSGTLPTYQLAELCFSGKYTLDQVKKIICGKGGVVAYLGTNDFYEVELKMADDPRFKFIADAFIYNVAKEVGAMAAVLKGKVDAILLTGGVAKGKGLMKDLTEYIEFIAPVKVYPGEDEMAALAMNGFAVLEGREEAKVYS